MSCCTIPFPCNFPPYLVTEERQKWPPVVLNWGKITRPKKIDTKIAKMGYWVMHWKEIRDIISTKERSHGVEKKMLLKKSFHFSLDAIIWWWMFFFSPCVTSLFPPNFIVQKASKTDLWNAHIFVFTCLGKCFFVLETPWVCFLRK